MYFILCIKFLPLNPVGLPYFNLTCLPSPCLKYFVILQLLLISLCAKLLNVTTSLSFII